MLTEAQVKMQKAVLWQEACGKLRAMASVEGHRRLCDPLMSTDPWLKECAERWLKVNEAVEEFIEMMDSEGLSE